MLLNDLITISDLEFTSVLPVSTDETINGRTNAIIMSSQKYQFDIDTAVMTNKEYLSLFAQLSVLQGVFNTFKFKTPVSNENPDKTPLIISQLASSGQSVISFESHGELISGTFIKFEHDKCYAVVSATTTSATIYPSLTASISLNELAIVDQPEFTVEMMGDMPSVSVKASIGQKYSFSFIEAL